MKLDNMQVICTSIQTDNDASTSPLSFCIRKGTKRLIPTLY